LLEEGAARDRAKEEKIKFAKHFYDKEEL